MLNNMNWLQTNEDLSFRKLIMTSEYPENLKYDFNKNGQLRHIDTNEPFIFNYQNVCSDNYKRYQVLGSLITQYVYELLEKACKLQKINIPVNAPDNERHSLFFMSKDALTNCSALVVLLQDKGTFHAGQWGQKTIVHEGLQRGSQIPFIKMAQQCSCGVMVLNPNENFIDAKTEQECFSDSGKENTSCFLQPPLIISKSSSSSPEEHTMYIWDNFISKSAAENVAFIVHGYGGLVFINLLMQRTTEVMNKVCAVALIDSTHHTMHQTQGNPQVCTWIQKHCREWVSNSKPLDRSVDYLVKMDCPKVSSGTEKYSLTPSFTLQSIFKYLKNTFKVGTKQHFTRSQSATHLTRPQIAIQRKRIKKN